MGDGITGGGCCLAGGAGAINECVDSEAAAAGYEEQADNYNQAAAGFGFVPLAQASGVGGGIGADPAEDTFGGGGWFGLHQVVELRMDLCQPWKKRNAMICRAVR